jgi:(p)ppGpp synthase/HD superfamily hydrolase
MDKPFQPLVAALRLAVDFHEHQIDKQGKPYLMHLLRVAGRCTTEISMIVAILHDIVEDTQVTLEFIRMEFGEEIADAVDHLTRRKEQGESYDDFIERVMENAVAHYVKARDVVDHLRGEDAANLSLGLRNRYRLAYRTLTDLQWDKVKHLPDG